MSPWLPAAIDPPIKYTPPGAMKIFSAPEINCVVEFNPAANGNVIVPDPSAEIEYVIGPTVWLIRMLLRFAAWPVTEVSTKLPAPVEVSRKFVSRMFDSPPPGNSRLDTQ